MYLFLVNSEISINTKLLNKNNGPERTLIISKYSKTTKMKQKRKK